jgi:protein SCO1/2
MPFRTPRATLPALIALGLFLAMDAGAHSVSTGFDDVGVDQKLGALISLDSRFVGEQGEAVTLRQLVTAPTILALVYYECPNVCDLLLTGLAGAVGSLDAQPGTDYNVVSISIDPDETPRDARKAKRLGLETIQKPFPPQSWRFLTGDAENIRAVAQSIGFHYKASGDGFDHPVAIVILSPSGKIVRYMFGADFLPADLKLSLLEAQRGTIGPTIARIARICFRVDPKSHTLVFMTMRVVATVTLACAAALVLYLVLSGRRRRKLSGS